MTAFADAAGQLAGAVGVTLGWRPDDFWRATPAEVGAVVRALAGPVGDGVDRALLESLKERWPDG